jgi:hypothetical protein
VCATCKSSRQCARDLARGDAQTGMETYCLNAPTVDSLIVDWPVALKPPERGLVLERRLLALRTTRAGGEAGAHVGDDLPDLLA